MSGIKRFDVEAQDDCGCIEISHEHGDYVYYSDHEEEVARLRAEVEVGERSLADAMGLLAESDAENARLETQVDRLRNALEEIASIRLNDHPSIDAAYGHACSIANEALFDHSDAAMGASA